MIQWSGERREESGKWKVESGSGKWKWKVGREKEREREFSVFNLKCLS